MKAVSGETMQLMDKRAMQEFGLSGLMLMENAGRACADAISVRFGPGEGRHALIVAGKGNNGGDGYVIARYLRQRGWSAPVLVLSRPEGITGDAATNLALLHDEGVIFAPEGVLFHRDLFCGATFVVDALLGTGVRSEVRGHYAEAIALINEAGVPVVSVDVPSGVDAGSGAILGSAVRADLTVSLALAKFGNIFFPGADLNGSLLIADIGMPRQVVEEAPGLEVVDDALVRSLLRPRSMSAHKGSCGHTLLIAGSTGKSGAAAMAAASAVRAGGGLVTLAIPASLNPVLEVKSTEAMTLPVADLGRGYFPAGALPALLRAAEGKDAVALGPGTGTSPSTVYLIHSLLDALSPPLVLDADGLNAVAQHPDLLLKRQGRVTVLTPHPGEMARLNGCSVLQVEADRVGAARDFARRYGVYLVLKGARTVIAAPDGAVAVNRSGNAGMASGGMGDILTGILVSLLGQGYPPFDACRIGVFVHGHAADLLAETKGMVGMNATDVQEQLPSAFAALAHGPASP